MKNKRISQVITLFHGRTTPEEGTLVGYGALIEELALAVPLPKLLALISKRKRKYKTEHWLVFSPSYQPKDTLYKHLVFALKYEGIDLLIFKKLFEKIEKEKVAEMIKSEPVGQYSRKIWFLYEWLLETKLDIPDLKRGNFVPLIDEKIQYAIKKGVNSSRHRIVNNLPGTSKFCPLIWRTEKIDQYIQSDFSHLRNEYLSSIHKDIIQRASSFLLLKDSKASFTIEGESPKSKRASRWGQAIGQAGAKPLNREELVRLQQLVIENSRFTPMGLRKEGGFVGEHDRSSGEPIPEHISSKWQDVEELVDGLLLTNSLLQESEFDAVLAASVVAFGFVFIHPFVDGNGRIHRYLIHHILARKRFAQQGIIFPVSSSILDHIDDYRRVLETYSHPLLDFIEWKTTPNNNVEVLNETIDYYRYFDATAQAEFLYDCVQDTIENIIPSEVKYLQHYDEFKRFLDDEFEMPDKTVALLVRFLEQNGGRFSKRAREGEFSILRNREVDQIEERFKKIFLTEFGLGRSPDRPE